MAGLVVGFLLDLGNQLAVDHVALLVEDDDGAGQETLKRAGDHRDPVVLAEGGAEVGSGGHVVDSLGPAEACLRERQVAGDAQHLGVGQSGGALVEGAHAHGAHACVDGGEDVEDQPGAGEVGERDGRQVIAHQLEARCLGAGRGQ